MGAFLLFYVILPGGILLPLNQTPPIIFWIKFILRFKEEYLTFFRLGRESSRRAAIVMLRTYFWNDNLLLSSLRDPKRSHFDCYSMIPITKYECKGLCDESNPTFKLLMCISSSSVILFNCVLNKKLISEASKYHLECSPGTKQWRRPWSAHWRWSSRLLSPSLK